jgi:hypothetical protein
MDQFRTSAAMAAANRSRVRWDAAVLFMRRGSFDGMTRGGNFLRAFLPPLSIPVIPIIPSKISSVFSQKFSFSGGDWPHNGGCLLKLLPSP